MFSRNPEDYAWRVLPGRKVAHAICSGKSFCGHSATYEEHMFGQPKTNTKRCVSCIMDIVSGISAMSYKFMVDHVPSDVRRQQRKAFREYRESMAK